MSLAIAKPSQAPEAPRRNGTMTHIPRLTTLALVAVLAAGCAANVGTSPSTAPTESIGAAASTEPSGSPTPEPSIDAPSPEPSPDPSALINCPRPESDDSFATLQNEADLYLPLEFDAIARLDGGEPIAWPRGWDPLLPSFFLGGRETRFYPEYSDYRPADIVMSELQVRLVMDDGTRHDVDATFEPEEDGSNRAVVRMPDIEGKGTMRISLAWRDSCYEVSARTSSRVIIDQPSSVAGCPEGRNRGFDELLAAFEPAIEVGAIEADLIPWRFEGKVAPLWVIDPLPPYVGFARDTATMTVSPGASVTVTNTNSALKLESLDGRDVFAFERAPLIRWLEDGWIHGNEPDAEVVFRGHLVTNDDGTFTFTVPTEPGRYGLEVIFAYDAECTYGTAGFVVGVDVATP